MRKLTGNLFLENMSPKEEAIAEKVESILPEIRKHAAQTDEQGAFPKSHLNLFQQTGLTGLMVPQEYGGLEGSLRDLTATTFALGTACPSTALCFFFHCSTSSRGDLALKAIKQGLFNDKEESKVRDFAEKVLGRMGHEGLWFGNFASESSKSQNSAVTIDTEAEPVDGGYLLTGVKSFGCSTGIADRYLVTAKMKGSNDAEGLATFFVDPDANGIRERTKWNAIGMRGTATHGLIMDKVFVPEDEALTVNGAFTKMMSVSRGSFVGNQLAGTACYLGAAHEVYQSTLDRLMTRTFADTGRPLAEAPMQQEIIGKMTQELETATMWLRRQLELETSEPPILAKNKVIQQWRLCKGVVSEAAFAVASYALKSGGTGGTDNNGTNARALRDLSMGLVQAFPPERGRLEAAKMITSSMEQSLFGVKN